MYFCIDSDSEWTHVYFEIDESVHKPGSFLSSTISNLLPFTLYAVYVRADLTLDYHYHWSTTTTTKARLLSSQDRLVSRIQYIQTLPDQPDAPLKPFHQIVKSSDQQSTHIIYLLYSNLSSIYRVEI